MSEAQPTVVLPSPAMRRLPRPFLAFVRNTGFGLAGLMCTIAVLGRSFGAFLMTLAIVGGPAALVLLGRSRRDGEVHLEPGGLRWVKPGEEFFLPSDRVAGGYLAHKLAIPRVGRSSHGGPVMVPRRVVLQWENGSEWLVDLEDVEAAERVMAHVGLSAGRRAVVAPLRGELGAFTRGLLALFFSMFAFVPIAGAFTHGRTFWPGMLAAILFTVFCVRRFGYPRVIVGTDGIRLVGRLIPRFLPYSEIADVARTPSAFASGYSSSIVLTCKDRRVVLPTIAQSSDAEQALFARIQAGLRAYAQGGRDRMLGALARGGRTTEAWKASLTQLAHVEAGFRQQSYGREDFEGVLADPRAEADQRLGAALALRRVDEAAGPRILDVAASSANVRLRVALEAAAEGEVDEAALEDAMKAQRRMT